MHIHARIERDLTEISTEKQSVFILSSVDTYRIDVTVEIGVQCTTKDGNILHIGVCEFVNLVSCLELIRPRVIVVVLSHWVPYSDNPT